MTAKETVHIADTSAFIGGVAQLIGFIRLFTVPEVVRELEDNPVIKGLIKKGVDDSDIFIQPPKHESVEKVIQASSETGDIGKLSLTDIDLIALARDLSEKYNVIVLSDDYAIQNVCKKIDLKVKSIKERGITKSITWVKYCPACFREFLSRGAVECDVCGSKLKVKPSKKVR